MKNFQDLKYFDSSNFGLKLSFFIFKTFSFWKESNFSEEFFQQSLFTYDMIHLFKKIHKRNLHCMIYSDITLVCQRIVFVSRAFTKQFIEKNCLEVIITRIFKSHKFSNKKIFKEVDSTRTELINCLIRYVCLFGNVIQQEKTVIEKLKKLRFNAILRRKMEFLENYKSDTNVNKLRFCCFLVLYLIEKSSKLLTQFDDSYLPFMIEILEDLLEKNITNYLISFSITDYLLLLLELTAINNLSVSFFVNFIPLLKSFYLRSKNKFTRNIIFQCSENLLANFCPQFKTVLGYKSREEMVIEDS